ncbi:DUF6924 domain-containing protein [Microbacterium sp.]|uniref:DUF6924 domain-containing protein n=1 Tax=Microbacterium sp. TaxID=51671 RepID=UPI003A8D2EEA
MSPLPKSDNPLLVRSIRSGTLEWESLLTAVGTETIDGFRPDVDVVHDPHWYGMEAGQLCAAMPQTAGSVLFGADETAVTSAEFPILVVDLDENCPPFRCLAAELWSVENNLNVLTRTGKSSRAQSTRTACIAVTVRRPRRRKPIQCVCFVPHPPTTRA